MTATATDTEERAGDPSAPAVAVATSARWALFGLTAVAVAAADQLTKTYVDANFDLAALGARPGDPGAPTDVLGDLVRIAKGYNDGGIFGLVGDSAVLLGLASLGVIAVIVYYQARHGLRSGPLLSLTLGLLLGGAIGNLIDRLSHGHVIDWVDMGIGTTRWYTFNVADAAISSSIVLLIALSIFGDRIPGGRMSDGSSEP